MKLDIKTLAPLYACLALALTACGGGGGDSTSDTSGTTTTPAVTAAGCLNASSLSAGYNDSLTYQYTEKSTTTTNTGTATVSSRVIGNVAFNGSNAVKSAQAETLVLNGTSSTTNAYVYANIADNKYVEYGSEDLNTAGTVTSTVVYKPAYVLDFSLAAGKSTSSTYTQTTNNGTPLSIASTLQFVGLETLTTAAGTFTSACRFSQNDTWTNTTATSEIWLSSGSMIPLKTVDTYVETASGQPVVTVVTRELTAGTVNGVALKP